MGSFDLQRLFNLDEFRNAIVHLLDGLVFSQTHAALVGDVIDTALGFGVFAAGSTDLQVVFVGDGFQLGVVLGQFRYLDVDRSTDGGSQVGRARVNTHPPFAESSELKSAAEKSA